MGRGGEGQGNASKMKMDFKHEKMFKSTYYKQNAN